VALAGCQAAAPAAAPATKEGVANDQNNARSDLSGTLLAPSGDVTAARAVLQNEAGQEASGKSGAPTTKGYFTIAGAEVGSYFAVATFADGSTQEAVVATSSYYNPISLATSLVAAYAHQQLATRLVFLPDLPQQLLASLADELEPVVKSRSLTLSQGQDARLGQFDGVKNANERTTRLLADIDGILAGHADANKLRAPAHTAQSDYEAKKKKLGL
jgi:hypothetical protein